MDDDFRIAAVSSLKESVRLAFSLFPTVKVFAIFKAFIKHGWLDRLFCLTDFFKKNEFKKNEFKLYMFEGLEELLTQTADHFLQKSLNYILNHFSCQFEMVYCNVYCRILLCNYFLKMTFF